MPEDKKHNSKIRTTVEMDAEAIKFLDIAAEADGTTLGAQIEKALKQYTDERRTYGSSKPEKVVMNVDSEVAIKLLHLAIIEALGSYVGRRCCEESYLKARAKRETRHKELNDALANGVIRVVNVKGIK